MEQLNHSMEFVLARGTILRENTNSVVKTQNQEISGSAGNLLYRLTVLTPPLLVKLVTIWSW